MLGVVAAAALAGGVLRRDSGLLVVAIAIGLVGLALLILDILKDPRT